MHLRILNKVCPIGVVTLDPATVAEFKHYSRADGEWR